VRVYRTPRPRKPVDNGNNFVDTTAASLKQYRDFANDPYYALTR